MVSLDSLEKAENSDDLGRIKRGDAEGTAMLTLDGLSVSLDNGTAVIKETEVHIEPGERVLVAGESGSGKSTLVRAIAGLFAWGGGSVGHPPPGPKSSDVEKMRSINCVNRSAASDSRNLLDEIR